MSVVIIGVALWMFGLALLLESKKLIEHERRIKLLEEGEE